MANFGVRSLPWIIGLATLAGCRRRPPYEDGVPGLRKSFATKGLSVSRIASPSELQQLYPGVPSECVVISGCDITATKCALRFPNAWAAADTFLPPRSEHDRAVLQAIGFVGRQNVDEYLILHGDCHLTIGGGATSGRCGVVSDVCADVEHLYFSQGAGWW